MWQSPGKKTNTSFITAAANCIEKTQNQSEVKKAFEFAKEAFEDAKQNNIADMATHNIMIDLALKSEKLEYAKGIFDQFKEKPNVKNKVLDLHGHSFGIFIGWSTRDWQNSFGKGYSAGLNCLFLGIFLGL